MHVLLLLLLVASLSGVDAAVTLPKPSANAGRTGSYQADTSNPANRYWVCVPKSYDGKRGAGLHVFFHGQGGSGSAPNFAQWQQALLEPFCLIGVNMQYTDNDNTIATAGKADSALEAALQVMADYKVVPGRGMTACFSGGGMPCGNWYSRQGRNRGLAWPFTALALYGANFWDPVVAGPPCGWFIGIGTQEWNMGIPTLGTSQSQRMGEALRLVKAFGPDQRFQVVAGLGHSIGDTELAEAAALFRRVDLAYAPFLYAPDFSEKALAAAVAQANAGLLGSAAAALGRIKDTALAEKIAALIAAIDARAAEQVTLVASLAGSDLLLANSYGGIFARGLKGHAREAELAPVLKELAKERGRTAAAAAAFAAFVNAFPRMLPSGTEARLAASAVPVLEHALKAAGEDSRLGAMAKELLALPREESSGPGKAP